MAGMGQRGTTARLRYAGYPGIFAGGGVVTAPVRLAALPSFIERCKAKALAWHEGEIGLHDAVDGLQQAAEAYGLVIELGQDRVQAIMVQAFAPLRSDLPR